MKEGVRDALESSARVCRHSNFEYKRDSSQISKQTGLELASGHAYSGYLSVRVTVANPKVIYEP